ncbi:MAG: type II 3-dehydroquinate dehydratase [Bacteroidales bacterium]|nr:type II 3-dehydroquinate dehydratase [Bacteroidales bacterium]
MKVLILNGPNLNLLGKREKSIYGDISFDKYLIKLKKLFKDIEIDYYQSNSEGEIIDKMQSVFLAKSNYKAIILNAGAYSHTSVAIADCIAAIDIPVIEVHISNIYSREEFRHKSIISAYCKGVITGFGLNSYQLALFYISNL